MASNRGAKLKKETYSFFIAKALDELSPGGTLAIICSDTFLTIKTMAGLRMLLMDRGQPTVERLDEFSEETSYDMVTLTLRSGEPAAEATICGQSVRRGAMEATGNYSWTVSEEYARLFAGPTIGDLMVATGGMTIGRNELFVREIVDGEVREPLAFGFAERPITLEEELGHARLGKLSVRQQNEIRAREAQGYTRRIVVTETRAHPVAVKLPHPDYAYYNKASGKRLYAPPAHAVYWKDDGDAVLTFKKSGPWYLRGVGGGPYFGREGLTWQLVAPRINARYLPPGYILDSGRRALSCATGSMRTSCGSCSDGFRRGLRRRSSRRSSTTPATSRARTSSGFPTPGGSPNPEGGRRSRSPGMPCGACGPATKK